MAKAKEAQLTSWRDRVVEVRLMRAGDILPHPLQHKKHPEKQNAALRGNLNETGKVDVLRAYYSERNGGKLTYFDGHGRNGLNPNEMWRVLICDLSDAEADLQLAVFDPLAGLATYDRDLFSELLAEVKTEEDGLKQLLNDLALKSQVMPGGIGLDDITLEEDSERVAVSFEQRIILCVPPAEYEDARKAILALLESKPTWDAKFAK